MDDQSFDIADTQENLPLVITDIDDLQEDPDFDLFLPAEPVSMEFAHICAKTAASMKFISDARIFLEKDPEHLFANVIKQHVRKLREMEFEFSEWTTVEDFIISLQSVSMPEATDLSF